MEAGREVRNLRVRAYVEAADDVGLARVEQRALVRRQCDPASARLPVEGYSERTKRSARRTELEDASARGLGYIDVARVVGRAAFGERREAAAEPGLDQVARAVDLR